jgi:hypothetical protein
MHLVEEDILIDAWAGVVERGNEVVEGLYYRQQGRKKNSCLIIGCWSGTCVLSLGMCHVQSLQ